MEETILPSSLPRQAALASRPDLLRGMTDPKISEALALMQRSPKEAKEKFQDDPEVTTYEPLVRVIKPNSAVSLTSPTHVKSSDERFR